MNVKTYILTALATLAFVACSHIDEGDRLIYVEPTVPNNSVSRCVLLEDFTGQRCVNCPKANDEIRALQEQYGADSVIAVAIHSGPLGFHTNAKFVGLSTDTGDEYYNHWGLEYQPVGLVNRGVPTEYTAWNTRIREELQKPAPVSINIAVLRNNDELTIRADVEGIEGTVSGHLQLWVVEDNVTAFQLMPDGTRNDAYLHQHVFRGKSTTSPSSPSSTTTKASCKSEKKNYKICMRMKKNLLLTLSIMLFTATMTSAQSFEFQYQGKSVVDGGTVTIAAVPDDFGFGEYWCETNPSSDPNNGLILKLLSGSTATGSATINIERNTLNPQTLKWCMGGACTMLNGKTTLDKTFTISGGSVQVQFDAENCQSEGDLLASLSATVGGETHTVKILFTYGSAGIEGTVMSEEIKDKGYFTLDGRRIEHPSKGVYITNGKKIIFK